VLGCCYNAGADGAVEVVAVVEVEVVVVVVPLPGCPLHCIAS